MTKPRLRDLGITIGTQPTGRYNAITAVPGVRVGQTTVIHGEGPLVVGQGPARVVRVGEPEYTVGVLVQGNVGRRPNLLVDGVPVGLEITDLLPEQGMTPEQKRDGSIIVAIGTDAPLTDRQLGRLCRRGMLGLGRVGAAATHSSGDLLIAFANAPENR